MSSNLSSTKVLLEGSVNSIHELEGVKVAISGDLHSSLDADGQILGHLATLDGLDDGSFQSLGEVLELLVLIKLGSVEKTTGPGIDRGDGVGGGLFTLLVLSVVTGNGTVSSFSLN